jgi:hypothetical protein
MFRRKKKDPPPPPPDCGHTEEEHRAIFRKILNGIKEDELKELEPLPPPNPLPFPLDADGAPMRGLNAWH